ncbi:zinc/manganese transport system ATP-binding protein [Nocardioides zeae]|uniref:Zinc/manganese transport system ATP-binding protein n=1 Tax=Nocardioides zeae TaxID=1457234 RepID=A0ACC6IG17_9ACTN|nr:zinc ABC transporter ATP-binding protein AztA [Nocardioides zeae]MDR6176424.1 zinc/manganese transport system ATP-binding protein [Nocardioides zeae]MDR6209437.1 zinc/manganese transport system ATP-binding protein [Nocardioides zeae]
MPASPPAVQLRDIRVDFGARAALRDVTLDLYADAVTVVAGPNGAGKSTLLEVVAGTRVPTRGSRSTRGTTAFVPQRAGVSDLLPITVHDVVAVGTWGRLGAWRRADAAARAAVDEALHRLGIADLRRRPYVALSGGQRQRALLAQGVVARADLLLLDEPTTGLDATSGARIRAVMAEEAARGAAVVCVSHDPAVLAAADRVVTLADGEVAGDTLAAGVVAPALRKTAR